jgi:hypothetical protein
MTLSPPVCPGDHGPMAEQLPDDQTLIMEVLFDIRKNTVHIIELLREEEDDGQEEANDS